MSRFDRCGCGDPGMIRAIVDADEFGAGQRVPLTILDRFDRGDGDQRTWDHGGQHWHVEDQQQWDQQQREQAQTQRPLDGR